MKKQITDQQITELKNRVLDMLNESDYDMGETQRAFDAADDKSNAVDAALKEIGLGIDMLDEEQYDELKSKIEDGIDWVPEHFKLAVEDHAAP